MTEPICVFIKDVKKTDPARSFSVVGFADTGGLISNLITIDKSSLGERHVHENGFELVFLVKGKQDFITDSGKYTLSEPGDRIYFPTGCAHADVYYAGTTVLVVRDTNDKKIL